MATPEPIPLARPDIGAREQELVNRVLASGRLSLGPTLERFEQGFAAWLGARHAIAVSSGTAALHLAVRGVGWGQGDRVVTTPLSFVASSNCLLYEDAEPVFCDIDPVTLNLDPDAAAAAIDGSVAGILPVHIFGYPAAIGTLDGLAERHGIGLVEDACQALGATAADGTAVGAGRNPAAFAFYANKQLATGEGGMLATADERLAWQIRSERNQGRSPDTDEVAHVTLGFNYRLSDVAAAIGVGQLERLDELLARRAGVAAAYSQRLGSLGGAAAGAGDPADLVLPCADRGEERRSWFVYVVQLPEGVERSRVISSLAEQGIQSKAYLPCIHLMPHYRERFGYRGGEFPVAEGVASRSVALPFFASMEEAQVERVCGALARALGR